MIVAIVGILAQLVIALLGLLLTWQSAVRNPNEITRQISDEIRNEAQKPFGYSDVLLNTLVNLSKTVTDEMRKKRRIYNALFITMVLAAFFQIFQLYGSLNYFNRTDLEQALKNHRVIQKERVYNFVKNEVIVGIGPGGKFQEESDAFRTELDAPIKVILARCSIMTEQNTEIVNPSNITLGGKGLIVPGFETLFTDAAKKFSTKVANDVFFKHFNGFNDSPVFKHMDAPLEISPILIPVLASDNLGTWVEEKEKNTNLDVQCNREPKSLYEALSCSLEENLAGDLPKCVFTACFDLTESMGIDAELALRAREYCQLRGLTMEPENRTEKSIFSGIYDKVWEQVRIYDKKKIVEDYLKFKSWYDPLFGGAFSAN